MAPRRFLALACLAGAARAQNDYSHVSGAQYCSGDETWYHCGTEECNNYQPCSSNTGLNHCMCPKWDPTPQPTPRRAPAR